MIAQQEAAKHFWEKTKTLTDTQRKDEAQNAKKAANAACRQKQGNTPTERKGKHERGRRSHRVGTRSAHSRNEEKHRRVRQRSTGGATSTNSAHLNMAIRATTRKHPWPAASQHKKSGMAKRCKTQAAREPTRRAKPPAMRPAWARTKHAGTRWQTKAEGEKDETRHAKHARGASNCATFDTEKGSAEARAKKQGTVHGHGNKQRHGTGKKCADSTHSKADNRIKRTRCVEHALCKGAVTGKTRGKRTQRNQQGQRTRRERNRGTDTAVNTKGMHTDWESAVQQTKKVDPSRTEETDRAAQKTGASTHARKGTHNTSSRRQRG
ncbi:hypothetical protein TvY486_0014830 [Trypanosoma vivax Y486]|uniref:Uncharacterized protein n=1 Tax=Trypanosoma vivax (strain Y486) TaxID=1055687 RepID=F9WMM3_TRYVY|nr:hypothetical protein TvY486_0014830 [Trypanosoma vivax Y486]|eukprot:CCD18780.1 hypothetical protein TvY486_0014830 [Trypanosoma vivax Y486]